MIEAKDPYYLRQLPYLIGTAEYCEDERVGTAQLYESEDSDGEEESGGEESSGEDVSRDNISVSTLPPPHQDLPPSLPTIGMNKHNRAEVFG